MIKTLKSIAGRLHKNSSKGRRIKQPQDHDQHYQAHHENRPKQPAISDHPLPRIEHNHLPLPSQQYRENLQNGTLKPDSDQEAVLPVLDEFVHKMHLAVEKKTYRRVEIWSAIHGVGIPRGIYLFGPVGRGKSMLMQSVFNAVAFKEKRRVHFHPFMQELQQRMHDTKPTHGIDIMLQVASEISKEARLLCFDEFFIDNIQDAMLLGRLLEYLFKCGTTLCATSNNGPEGLFKGGFNRKRFLPLLADIQANIHELDLSHGADWRRRDEPTSIKPGETPDRLFTLLTGKAPIPRQIVLDRMLVTAKGGSLDIYWFDFFSLCEQQLGPAEYMDLSQKAQAIIISELPALDADNSDAAMRLIILIDLLYELKVPLRIFSSVELEKVCTTGPAAFPFRRAVSRIFSLMRLEMAKGSQGHIGNPETLK
jgi:cell division protein ZapE